MMTTAREDRDELQDLLDGHDWFKVEKKPEAEAIRKRNRKKIADLVAKLGSYGEGMMLNKINELNGGHNGI
jgi:hypothetical protein